MGDRTAWLAWDSGRKYLSWVLRPFWNPAVYLYRLVAIALLGIYAVPAAIGPHWHSHHHSSTQAVECSDCCSTACEKVDTSDCPFEARRAAKIPHTSLNGLDCDHDACSICKFYSLSQLHSANETLKCINRCADLFLPASSQAAQDVIGFSQARAPPC